MAYRLSADDQGRVNFEEWDPELHKFKEPRRVISAAEAARLLKRTRRHLYRLIQRGWLHSVVIFANQHFLDWEEVQALRQKRFSSRTPSLPKGLAHLFPEYDRRGLQLERDADLILSRILERGDPLALRWAHRHFSRSRELQFLRRQGRRLLSPRALHFWSWLWRQPRIPRSQGWRRSGHALGGIA